jgi:hypothetical protein
MVSELTAHTDSKEASPKTTQSACPIGQYLKLDVESQLNHVFSILIDAQKMRHKEDGVSTAWNA